MTRDKLLAIAKPILFRTDDVRTILDGEKTATRIVIKLKYDNTHIKVRKDKYGKSVVEIENDVREETYGTNPDGSHWHKLRAYIEKYPPYKVGDILYVRECFRKVGGILYGRENGTYVPLDDFEGYQYKADDSYFITKGIHPFCECFEDQKEDVKHGIWRPSIHMPKEAARIFLRVTDVKAKQLQDMWASDVSREGICFTKPTTTDEMIRAFENLWNMPRTPVTLVMG